MENPAFRAPGSPGDPLSPHTARSEASGYARHGARAPNASHRKPLGPSMPLENPLSPRGDVLVGWQSPLPRAGAADASCFDTPISRRLATANFSPSPSAKGGTCAGTSSAGSVQPGSGLLALHWACSPPAGSQAFFDAERQLEDITALLLSPAQGARLVPAPRTARPASHQRRRCLDFSAPAPQPPAAVASAADPACDLPAAAPSSSRQAVADTRMAAAAPAELWVAAPAVAAGRLVPLRGGGLGAPACASPAEGARAVVQPTPGVLVASLQIPCDLDCSALEQLAHSPLLLSPGPLPLGGGGVPGSQQGAPVRVAAVATPALARTPAALWASPATASGVPVGGSGDSTQLSAAACLMCDEDLGDRASPFPSSQRLPSADAADAAPESGALTRDAGVAAATVGAAAQASCERAGMQAVVQAQAGAAAQADRSAEHAREDASGWDGGDALCDDAVQPPPPPPPAPAAGSPGSRGRVAEALAGGTQARAGDVQAATPSTRTPGRAALGDGSNGGESPACEAGGVPLATPGALMPSMQALAMAPAGAVASLFAPATPRDGAVDGPLQRRTCKCRKTKCLKMYCDCFAGGMYCCEGCACEQCSNNEQVADEVAEARRSILRRNPQAFSGSPATPAPTTRSRGCKCKRSHCLKKYCVCFAAGLPCGESCKCCQCENAGDGGTPGSGGAGRPTAATAFLPVVWHVPPPASAVTFASVPAPAVARPMAPRAIALVDPPPATPAAAPATALAGGRSSPSQTAHGASTSSVHAGAASHHPGIGTPRRLVPDSAGGSCEGSGEGTPTAGVSRQSSGVSTPQHTATAPLTRPAAHALLAQQAQQAQRMLCAAAPELQAAYGAAVAASLSPVRAAGAWSDGGSPRASGSDGGARSPGVEAAPSGGAFAAGAKPATTPLRTRRARRTRLSCVTRGDAGDAPGCGSSPAPAAEAPACVVSGPPDCVGREAGGAPTAWLREEDAGTGELSPLPNSSQLMPPPPTRAPAPHATQTPRPQPTGATQSHQSSHRPGGPARGEAASASCSSPAGAPHLAPLVQLGAGGPLVPIPGLGLARAGREGGGGGGAVAGAAFPDGAVEGGRDGGGPAAAADGEGEAAGVMIYLENELGEVTAYFLPGASCAGDASASPVSSAAAAGAVRPSPPRGAAAAAGAAGRAAQPSEGGRAAHGWCASPGGSASTSVSCVGGGGGLCVASAPTSLSCAGSQPGGGRPTPVKRKAGCGSVMSVYEEGSENVECGSPLKVQHTRSAAAAAAALRVPSSPLGPRNAGAAADAAWRTVGPQGWQALMPDTVASPARSTQVAPAAPRAMRLGAGRHSVSSL